MNILYIGIYGVHYMEFIYYIMRLEFVAMPAIKLGMSRWAGEQTLNPIRAARGFAQRPFVLSPTIRGTRENATWGDHASMVATT